jgi:hypothetical protein
MNEGRCLEAVSGSFPRQFRGREAAQFVIDERKQFIGGLGVALLNSVEDASDVAHRLDGTWALLNFQGRRDTKDTKYQTFTQLPSRRFSPGNASP